MYCVHFLPNFFWLKNLMKISCFFQNFTVWNIIISSQIVMCWKPSISHVSGTHKITIQGQWGNSVIHFVLFLTIILTPKILKRIFTDPFTRIQEYELQIPGFKKHYREKRLHRKKQVEFLSLVTIKIMFETLNIILMKV